jgi:uncharacterized RDD family membrane protein YckC
LGNYIIDIILFYALLFAMGMLLAMLAPAAASTIFSDDSGFQVVDRILSMVLYALYMGTVEAVFKGKSLGKLLTRTRALNLDGTTISPRTAFARGFARAVPFCVLSALSSPCNPWQDKWTNTIVVDEKSSLYQATTDPA